MGLIGDSFSTTEFLPTAAQGCPCPPLLPDFNIPPPPDPFLFMDADDESSPAMQETTCSGNLFNEIAKDISADYLPSSLAGLLGDYAVFIVSALIAFAVFVLGVTLGMCYCKRHGKCRWWAKQASGPPSVSLSGSYPVTSSHIQWSGSGNSKRLSVRTTPKDDQLYETSLGMIMYGQSNSTLRSSTPQSLLRTICQDHNMFDAYSSSRSPSQQHQQQQQYIANGSLYSVGDRQRKPQRTGSSHPLATAPSSLRAYSSHANQEPIYEEIPVMILDERYRSAQLQREVPSSSASSGSPLQYRSSISIPDSSYGGSGQLFSKRASSHRGHARELLPAAPLKISQSTQSDDLFPANHDEDDNEDSCCDCGRESGYVTENLHNFGTWNTGKCPSSSNNSDEDMIRNHHTIGHVHPTSSVPTLTKLNSRRKRRKPPPLQIAAEANTEAIQWINSKDEASCSPLAIFSQSGSKSAFV